MAIMACIGHRVRVRVRFRIAIRVSDKPIGVKLRFLTCRRQGDSNQGGIGRTRRRLTCYHYVAGVPDKNWVRVRVRVRVRIALG